jgi:hypothetical protein
MVQWESIQELMDEVVKDITKRMAGIDLERASTDALPSDGKVSALIAEVSGTDGFTLVYNAEDALLREIAQKMKRKPVEDMDEVGEYTREYFNVICGHVISQLNRKTQSTLRFALPQYLPFPFGGKNSRNALVLYYQSCKGSARVQGVYAEN